jgi:hypothetical protein
MNYRKTKTIQKQGTINRVGLLSSLLLVFLVVSCGPHNNGGGHHSPSNNNKEGETNQKLKEDFLVWLGGWGPCKDECFLSQLREDAKNSGRKPTTIGGVDSYLLPLKCSTDPSKTYFEGLVKQDVVAGTEEGRKKWRKMPFRRNKKQNVGALREGLYGLLKEIVETGIDSHSFKKATGLFVIDQYMKFQQSAEEILQNTTEKDLIALRLNEKLDELKVAMNKVKLGAKGVALVISVDENTDDIKQLVRFVDRSEEGNSKKTQRKKNFTLNKAEEAKFNKINEDIKTKIDALVQQLK